MAVRRRKVQTVRADLDDPGSLVAAMQGRSLVYHLAGHYPALSTDHAASLQRAQRQTRAVLDAAAQAGVQRLVYVSSTATVAPAAGGPSTEQLTFARAPGLGVYHDVKWHMEQQVLEERRLSTVIACPGACLGPFDLRIGTSALLVALARGVEVPHPDGWVNLVDVRDVALGLLAMARTSPRRVLMVGHNLRLQALMQRASERYGVDSPTDPLSPAEAVARADAEERRCEQEGGRPALSREIVDLVLHATPIDASLSKRALGLRYRSVEQTLDAFDTWARSARILPRQPLKEGAHDHSPAHP
jgi:dihydroflavonol-4-reductase